MDKATQELICGYLDKASENIGVAERLLTSGDYDVSISRSYYASFYAAHALLISEGLHVKSHGGLVGLFGLHFVKTGKIDKKYGRYLSNLLEDRQKATIASSPVWTAPTRKTPCWRLKSSSKKSPGCSSRMFDQSRLP